jgi:hypothetical protein
MSKAEDRYLELFQDGRLRNCSSKKAFLLGYHQAEKDVELTWEDTSKIISIDQQVCGTMGISDYTHNHQQAMEEVLKRFKERKENEIQDKV